MEYDTFYSNCQHTVPVLVLCPVKVIFRWEHRICRVQVVSTFNDRVKGVIVSSFSLFCPAVINFFFCFFSSTQSLRNVASLLSYQIEITAIPTRDRAQHTTLLQAYRLKEWEHFSCYFQCQPQLQTKSFSTVSSNQALTHLRVNCPLVPFVVSFD